MREKLTAFGTGCAVGAVTGVVAYATVAAAFFAFGGYSRHVFPEAAVIGALAGAAFGGVCHAGRLSPVKAGLLQAVVLACLISGHSLRVILSREGTSSIESSLGWVIKNAIFYTTAGFGAGALSQLLVARLRALVNANVQRSTHRVS